MDAADALQWGRECCVNDTTRGSTGDVALVLEAYVAKRVSREGKPSVGAEPRLSLLTPPQASPTPLPPLSLPPSLLKWGRGADQLALQNKHSH